MTELMGGLAIHLITITDNVRVKKIVLFPVMATYFTRCRTLPRFSESYICCFDNLIKRQKTM